MKQKQLLICNDDFDKFLSLLQTYLNSDKWEIYLDIDTNYKYSVILNKTKLFFKRIYRAIPIPKDEKFITEIQKLFDKGFEYDFELITKYDEDGKPLNGIVFVSKRSLF